MAGGGQPRTGGGPGLGAQFVPVCPVPSAQVRCIGPVPVMTRSLAWHDLSPVLTTTSPRPHHAKTCSPTSLPNVLLSHSCQQPTPSNNMMLSFTGKLILTNFFLAQNSKRIYQKKTKSFC